MTNWNSQRSDRIDTTVTLVHVRPGDDTSDKSAAARYVKREFPGAQILAIWRHDERATTGDPVYAVEWEDGEPL